jgi:hypothetical protein
MKVSFSIIALVLIVAACSGTAMPSRLTQTKSQKDTRVIDSLPTPDYQEIRKIRTGDAWHNPYVIVDRDGYELILHNQPRRDLHLSLDDLEQTLLKVPLEQWPLGKVVAVQETGLRSPGDNAKIASNLKAVKRMLESHKLRVDLWPSA